MYVYSMLTCDFYMSVPNDMLVVCALYVCISYDQLSSHCKLFIQGDGL